MNVPRTPSARQRQHGWVMKTTLLTLGVAAAVAGATVWGCQAERRWLFDEEDRITSGSFVENGDATSLNDIDSSSALAFLRGMLDAANTPRAGGESDAAWTFDNLAEFIRKNLKGMWDENNVNFAIEYGDGKEIRYAVSAWVDTITIKCHGVGGITHRDSITLTKHATNKAVYLVDPDSKNKKKTSVTGDEIRALIDSVVPNNA